MAYIPNPLIIPLGFLMGVLLALPFGPMNVLGLQRAVERGYFGGLAIGVGVLLGDGLIALGAALGVNAISGAIRQYRTVIQIVGGLALMVAGAKLYFETPQFATASDAERACLLDYVWDIPKAFFLTITNPSAVLGLIAMFGGLSTFVEVSSTIDALTLTASVMGGSFCYWVVVSKLISRVRGDLDAGWLGRMNLIAGLVLFAFGAVMIAEMVLKQLAYWWLWAPVKV
jgi:threonine/homoserine/homoserine lactone efflux protein